MSILKASLLAASFALVAASSVNAQTNRDYLFNEKTISATDGTMQQARQAYAAAPKSGKEWKPFSREAYERVTW